jgi:hypothetical protein
MRRATKHIKWRNSFVHCRHQWLSLILNTFSYSDFIWSHHDAESVEQEKKKGVNLSNKLTPNYLTKKREQISVRSRLFTHKRIWRLNRRNEVHDEVIWFFCFNFFWWINRSVIRLKSASCLNTLHIIVLNNFFFIFRTKRWQLLLFFEYIQVLRKMFKSKKENNQLFIYEIFFK